MTITKQQEKVVIENSVRWTRDDISWLKEAKLTIEKDGYPKVAKMLQIEIDKLEKRVPQPRQKMFRGKVLGVVH